MTKAHAVNWLLVGMGDIAAKRVAPALAATEPGKLVAVCDVVRERAERLAAEFSIREIYTDFDNALTRTSANVVYLATPVFLHARQTVSVLQAGKHVLVEKPLGINADDAAQAVTAVQRDLRAGCAYFRRCSPRYDHARHMIQEGRFGQIVLVRMTYFSWFGPDKSDPKYWRVVRSKSGGGPLSDMGSHMFDVLIGLLGMPKTVYARCSNLVHTWDVEDSAAIIMTLDNNAQVIASFNWNSKTWSHEFEIIGTEAKIKWHPYDTGPVVETVGRDIQQLDLPNPDNAHAPMIEDFVQAILKGRDPLVPLAEAAKTNALLDAVYHSAATEREIAL